MPKLRHRITRSPRRHFSLHVSFDKQHSGPHEVTFPVHSFAAQDEGFQPLEAHDGTPAPIGVEQNAPENGEPVPDPNPMPPPAGMPAGDGRLEGDQDCQNGDLDLEEDPPFSNLADKPFYGKGTRFQYYLYETHRILQEPPPHPAHLPIHIGTIFVHRNARSRQTRSWRRESSDDGQGRWTELQQSEQRAFDHGTYHYTLTKKGTPSWVVGETLRPRLINSGTSADNYRLFFPSPPPRQASVVPFSVAFVMTEGFWSQYIPAGDTVLVHEDYRIRVTSTCLEPTRDTRGGRGSLEFSERGKQPAAVSALHRHVWILTVSRKYEQDVLDIELQPGRAYEFTAKGFFSMSLTGTKYPTEPSVKTERTPAGSQSRARDSVTPTRPHATPPEKSNTDDSSGGKSSSSGRNGSGRGSKSEKVATADGSSKKRSNAGKDDSERTSDANQEPSEEGDGAFEANAEEDDKRQLASLLDRMSPLGSDELESLFEDLSIAPHAIRRTDGNDFVPSGMGAIPPRWQRQRGDKIMVLYDIDGYTEDYSPFMCAEDLEWIYGVYEAVESYYFKNLPLHLSDPDRSIFKRMTKDEMSRMGGQELRRCFPNRCIIVPGARRSTEEDAEEVEFTMDATEELVPSDQDITAHDFSLGRGEQRYATATMEQVVAEHRLGEKGKIVNCLELPLNGSIVPMPLFTDVQAFRETKRCPLPFNWPFPVTDHTWGLAALAGAFHIPHKDSDGLCTMVTVKCGVKWWAVVIPPPETGLPPMHFFGDIEQFMNFQPYESDNLPWKVEAVLLRPGDTLYMPPGIFHFVVTPKSSVCTGKHFYCSTTMAYTAASKITTLFLEPLLTNSSHDASQRLLQLHAVHCYDQLACCQRGGFLRLGYDIELPQDWHSFVMLHIMALFGPVLDRRFHVSHKDYGTFTEQDAIMMAYARGAALETIGHLESQSVLKITTSSSTVLDGPQAYFNEVAIQQAICLIRAFRRIVAVNDAVISSFNEGDTDRFATMVREALIFGNDDQLAKEFDKLIKKIDLDDNESYLAVPLPPEDMKTVITNRALIDGSSLQTHDCCTLIRRGLTPTLHKALRRYLQDHPVKVEDDTS
ncbi:hypothetical protein NMY22_g14104 [Coprinellus aureogranulatus]|nr:hypothetical protein NMY22_g14104 [Coprinellus aureogranulatus]